MQILLKEINFNINSLFLLIVLLILISLFCFVLLMLYYRLSHFGKKVNFSICSLKEDKLSPSEWEKQMLDLAKSHNQVRLTGYNFVLNDYNQVAYKKLNKIRDSISAVSTDIISLIPAARWLFDNFQMLYREIKKVPTSGTGYAVLPVLKGKEYRNFPRIYVVAKKMVALSGGHLNEENISVMLKAYQQKVPLTDKEIWVLPEVLGFCLLEEIITIADEILHMIDVKAKAEKFLRDKLADKRGPADLSALLCKTEDNLRLNYSFHAHVIYLLKNMSFDEASIQRYLEYHFASLGKQVKTSGIFLEEGKIESFLEANIRTFIVSLRDIDEVDEEKFFEEYSCLEQILLQDPDGVYQKMDLESRGMYRGVIVKLSLRYRLMEEKIAKDCLELAVQGREDLYCSHHVGTYLLGKGYPILKAKALGKPIPKSIKKRMNVCKKLEYENDRKRFIGRNNTLENPDSVVNSIAFSNNSGFCNDPIMSLRAQFCIGAGETVCISFITGVCGSKEEAIKIAGELNVSYRIDDILEKFRLQNNLELKYLEITRTQLNAFQDLISPVFYSAGIYRGPDEKIRRNFMNQSFLWKFGVSGDNPILLLTVRSIEEERIVKDVLKAYEYLRINRVMVDLIILINSKHGYLQEVDELINDMTSSLRIYDSGSEKPSFFTLHTYEMKPAEIDLLYTVARVVFSEKTGIYFTDTKENPYGLLEKNSL